MPELKFDETKCAKCKAISCLVKCQYMDFKDKDKAKKEWQNRRDALCCGRDSGNFVTDLLAGSVDSPARIRAREAYETGADTLAVI